MKPFAMELCIMIIQIPYEIPYGQKDMLKEAFSLMA